jgi:LSD1 subclass zinc finger protein
VREEIVPGGEDFVKVHVGCNRCGNVMKQWCVHVDRNVPDPLRYQPAGGGSGAREIRCPSCQAPCFEDVHELERAVADQISRGWGRHQKRGAVMVECRV